jgi:hypothetical protein
MRQELAHAEFVVNNQKIRHDLISSFGLGSLVFGLGLTPGSKTQDPKPKT